MSTASLQRHARGRPDVSIAARELDGSRANTRLLSSTPPLDARERAGIGGKRILVLLAAAGHAAQEVLKPVDAFERSGCSVTFASLDGGPVRLDPLCNVLAFAECAWDRTLRLLLRARRRRTLRDLPSLRARRAGTRGEFERWLGGFDAVMVPGGHGGTFAGFVRDPIIAETIASFAERGAPIGLQCHAVVAGALAGTPNVPLARGRTVTCWPRRYEARLARLPLLGRYLQPFGRPAASLLDDAGALVHDESGVYAAVDGTLITSRGPWNTAVFATAFLRALADAPAAGC